MQADPTDLWKRAAMRHPHVPAPENLDAKLWRYLSGEKFRWLVENRRLYMPRLAQLAHNDPREGTMPDAQAAWWHEEVKNANTPEEAENRLKLFHQLAWFVERYRLDWFVSCWTLSEAEDFAFWRIYGRAESACNSCGQTIVTSGQSVAITTTFRKLQDNLPAHIEVGLVGYSDYDVAKATDFNMYEYAMSKRHFYRYESEVRAITHLDLAGPPDHGSSIVRKHFESNMIDGSYAPPVNISALIDEVILHPEATRDFVEEITALCLRHALPKPRISGLSK